MARLPSNAFCFAKPHSNLPPTAAKVKICGDQQPGELASLPWFEKVSCRNKAVSSLISSSSVFVLGWGGWEIECIAQAINLDDINVQLPSTMARLAPVMKFVATFRR